jgi:hypothetical protein
MALPRSVEDDYFVNHALRSSSGGAEWYQQLSLDGVDINFKLDSGVTCNILPLEFSPACGKNVNVFAQALLFAAIVPRMVS